MIHSRTQHKQKSFLPDSLLLGSDFGHSDLIGTREVFYIQLSQCYARDVIFGRSALQLTVGIGLLFAASAAFAFQREFRDLGGERPTELGRDALDPAEFVFGRFMYPS